MMFFTRHIFLGDLLEGFEDCHSHLLWGVDDGSSSPEQSEQMLYQAAQMGFARMWCTPHIMEGMYLNDEKIVALRYAELSVKGGVPTALGAEYFLDEGFVGHLEGEPLTCGAGTLLVEMPLVNHSDKVWELIYVARLKGFQIMVAHPERYDFVGHDCMGAASLFAERGCTLQLNLPSLCGMYGQRVRSVAEQMLKQGCYAHAGSDAHSPSVLQTIRQTEFPRRLVASLQRIVN